MAINFDNTNVGSVTLATAATNTTLQFPTALGSSGTFLTTNGSGVASFTSFSPTFTGFTTSISSTGIFATTNRSNLSVATLSLSASVAIVPRGAGSVLASIPDGTIIGGDARGAVTSIDLQLPGQRTASNQVAAGFNSFIGGGYANRVTSLGTRAVIVGGSTNYADGNGVIMGGRNHTVTNNSTGSVILGGMYNQMDASWSVIVGGVGSTAWTGNFTTVYGSENFSSASTFGQAQTRFMCLTQVANANANFQLNNANVTTSGLTTVTAAQAVFVPTNSAVLVRSWVVQRRNTPVGNRAYHAVSLFKRGAGSVSNVLNSNTVYGTSGTVTSWGYSGGFVNTTSNTAAAIVNSTAGVASYVCGHMQVLDLRYP